MQLKDLTENASGQADSKPPWVRGKLNVRSDEMWSKEQWRLLEAEVRVAVLNSTNDESARKVISRWGRRVLRSYSSSFYAVTRFLPRAKREDVEIVYAAVRYPDEVVDTFNLSTRRKLVLLDEWLEHYQRSELMPTIHDAVSTGIPATLAGFRDMLRRNNIPETYYVEFIEAMRRDISPRGFSDWNDLIENYIYGSATVVGYFLANIYGTAVGRTLDECMRGARALAVALQLTNFARDVADDAARSRCYLPVNHINAKGNPLASLVLAGNPGAITESKSLLADQAAVWYKRAAQDLHVFNPDSRVAIDSCHRLYSALNTRILENASPFNRESLSFWSKLSVLPRSKYWRLPAAIVLER